MLSEFPAPGTLPAGGPQVAATRLVPELVQRGVDVVVVAPALWTSAETESELEGGGTLVAVPVSPRLQLANGMRGWRRGAQAVVERLNVDLVHGQNLLPGGIAAAGINGVPRVVTSRGNMREDTAAAYTGVGGAVRAHLRERLARTAFEHADVVVSVNPDWKINLPAQPKRFEFIPNIVDESFFARKHAPEPGRVLFAGGDNPIKGWDLLEQTWSRVLTSRGNMREDTVADYTGVGAAVRAHLRERLARRAFESADVVVSVNPDWKVNLPAQPKRFQFIPNIVHEDFFAREHVPDPGLVLFTGGDNAIKGWDLLEAAWPRVQKAVPDARLHVLGWRGDDKPALGPSVTAEGWVSAVELADRMTRAAVLVIASEFEVSPTVLAEAWAVGVPVVATAVGGIPALATDAAVLVERTPAALADGLVEALSGGEQMHALVAEATRRAERHRAAAVAAAHTELYEELR